MIKHFDGDATQPVLQAGHNVIVHCVNNIGAWGAGFVVPLGRRFPMAREAYMNARKRELGSIQVVLVQPDRVSPLFVCNLVGQRGIASPSNPSPISYEAFEEGFASLEEHMQQRGGAWTLHMPKMGAGLAGGNWEAIERLLQMHISYPIYVYTPRR